VSRVYHRVRGRSSYDRDSVLLRLLGRDLRRWAGPDGLVVVDHPAVAGALGDRADTWYLHGETVAPPEAVVRRAARVFVPLPETAAAFEQGGLPAGHALVTGLCVERALAESREERVRERQRRFETANALTVAFFSSGAEPVEHVRTLSAGARSLAADGRHRAIVFARSGGRLAAAARRPAAGSPEVVLHRDRAELDAQTAERFPAIDVVVSPPHERSNWALGLGVPFLLVGPDIGPFAPRNRTRLAREGVARAIDSAEAAVHLPVIIETLRDQGELLRMSERGTGLPVDGFDRAAAMLLAEAERRGHVARTGSGG
jgi:hypothetical protein